MSPPLDISALKALAEAATPGPWEVVDIEHDNRTIEPYVVFSWDSEERRWSEEDSTLLTRANAAFIAAANPSTVLALIARIEELAMQIETHNEFCHD